MMNLFFSRTHYPFQSKVDKFCDLHIHGAFKSDFMEITLDHEFEQRVENIGFKLWKRGIAAYAPTLLTAEPAFFEHAISRWGHLIEKIACGRWPKNCATPIGLHLEGPFLQSRSAGAHPKTFLKPPSIDLARRFLKLGRGQIKIITIAPELKGALPAIRLFARSGVRVQLGHSAATIVQSEKSWSSGARGLTHLFNAMVIHHRDPGISSLLSLGGTSEIITDTIHVHPLAVLNAAITYPNQLYGVSDCCSAHGSKNGEKCNLGSLSVYRDGPIACIAGKNRSAARPVLAGGTTLLSEHPARLWHELSKWFFSKECMGTRKEKRILQQIIFSLFNSSTAIAENLAGRKIYGPTLYFDSNLKILDSK